MKFSWSVPGITGPSPLPGQIDYISVYITFPLDAMSSAPVSTYSWGAILFFLCTTSLSLSQIYLEILGLPCLRSLKSGGKSHLLLDFYFLCFSMYPSACLQKCCQGFLSSHHFVLWCWYWWSITVTFLTLEPIGTQCQLMKTAKTNLSSK